MWSTWPAVCLFSSANWEIWFHIENSFNWCVSYNNTHLAVSLPSTKLKTPPEQSNLFGLFYKMRLWVNFSHITFQLCQLHHLMSNMSMMATMAEARTVRRRYNSWCQLRQSYGFFASNVEGWVWRSLTEKINKEWPKVDLHLPRLSSSTGYRVWECFVI